MRKGYHNYCAVNQFKKKDVCCYEKPLELYKGQIRLKPKKLEIIERIDNHNSRIIIGKETTATILNTEDLGKKLRQRR